VGRREVTGAVINCMQDDSRSDDSAQLMGKELALDQHASLVLPWHGARLRCVRAPVMAATSRVLLVQHRKQMRQTGSAGSL
jgi:hypothetical protein